MKQFWFTTANFTNISINKFILRNIGCKQKFIHETNYILYIKHFGNEVNIQKINTENIINSFLIVTNCKSSRGMEVSENQKQT